MNRYAWVFSLAAAAAMSGAAAGEGEAVLHGFSVGQGTVAITVTDCSCTSPEDFRFEINRVGGDLRMVKVIRLRPDMCEAPAQQSTFEYTFDEAGLPQGARILLKTPMKAFNPQSNDDCEPVH